MQVLILLVTWHVADLGSRPASHQSVRDVFSFNLSFSSATGCRGRNELPAADHAGEDFAVTQGDHL